MSEFSNILIDRFDLRLPEGFEKRADAIARHVAKQLSRLPVALSGDIDMPSIRVDRLKVTAGETNTVIARRIAGAIQQQIYSQHGNQSSPDTQTVSGARSQGDSQYVS